MVTLRKMSSYGFGAAKTLFYARDFGVDSRRVECKATRDSYVKVRLDECLLVHMDRHQCFSSKLQD